MKLKSNLIITSFILFLILGLGITTTQAQGIYSAPTNDKKASNIENTKSENNGGFFRGGPDEGDWGDGGEDQKPDPHGEDSPIGEGILILSLLSGAYAIIKRIKKKE